MVQRRWLVARKRRKRKKVKRMTEEEVREVFEEERIEKTEDLSPHEFQSKENRVITVFEVSLPSLDLITKFKYDHTAVSKNILEILSDLHE